jgi:MFS superfamily sulfate permease-like transporter
VVLVVRRAAVFSNWLGLRKAIVGQGECKDEVILDLSDTRLVDHSTMEKLHELEEEFAHGGKRLTVIGLDAHVPLSKHPYAARKSGYTPRVTA